MGREGEDPGRLLGREPTGQDMVEDEEPVLGPSVGRSRSVLGFHAPDSDKVAGRLTRTDSLVDDTK